MLPPCGCELALRGARWLARAANRLGPRRDRLLARCRSDGAGGDVLVLPSKPKGGSKGPRQLDEPQERHISRNEKRKLAQIARKKALRENLSQVGRGRRAPVSRPWGQLPGAAQPVRCLAS